jgi:hypothetical protein
MHDRSLPQQRCHGFISAPQRNEQHPRTKNEREGRGPDFDNDPGLRDQFLNFPHAGPSGRILSIGKTGLDTGASLDQEGRPVSKPTDIRGR